MQFLKKIIVFILTLESRLILAKYKPFIIAVTGSVGKTSTKDAIYSVLKHSPGFVRKSEKSFNSEIGLPLTLIGVPNAWHSVSEWSKNILAGLKLILFRNEYPDTLVLEIGADHPGDIKNTVRWLRPDIALITRFSRTPVHVEFFKSPEEVFEEKAALARAVKKGGTAVLFVDDEKVIGLEGELKAKGVNVLTFGTLESADIRGTSYSARVDGFNFRIISETSDISVEQRGIVGKTFMLPLLAAAAVGKIRGMNVTDINKGLNSYEAPKGRMNVLLGIKDTTIIDDTYNSSPDAVVSALETLKEMITTGRKIAVLGDMMELGKYSVEEHRKIGREVAKVAQVLVTVGQRSRATAEESLKEGMEKDLVSSFDTSDEAAKYLAEKVESHDIILVKGSQSVRMEKVVKALLKEPEKADKLLVRQEAEWLKKA